MQGERFDRLVRLLGAEADRRLLIRGIAGSALGAGALLPAQARAGAPALAAKFQDTPCQRLTVFSKKGWNFRVEGVSCPDPCRCDDQRIYEVGQDLTGELGVNNCDESEQEIPEGSLLRLVLTRRLRARGDGTLVGYHDGRFEIASTTGQPVLAGEVHGADGLDSNLPNCVPGRAEGVLLGNGAGPFEGCTFSASYRSQVYDIRDPENPCDIGWESLEALLVGVVACPCEPTDEQSGCIGFEGERLQVAVAAGMATYHIDETFEDSGVTMTVRKLFFEDGSTTRAGSVEVMPGGQAGGSGLEVNMRAANLAFDFGLMVSTVSLLFLNTRVTLNIEVNGDLRIVDDFGVIDGTSIGGAGVSVVQTPAGNGQQGMLELSGAVTSFVIGGQELVIDDVCVSW